MPTVQLEAHLSSNKLLEAVEQLSISELADFVNDVMALRARRIAPNLPRRESELLQKINEGVPDSIQTRFDELRHLQEEDKLTETSHAELMRLIEQIENIDAQRIQYLAELAQLRQMTVRDLMAELGIKPPD